VIGYILIGQNHLYLKMLFNRDYTIQKCSRDSALFASQEKSVPCQPSGRRAILSGRPTDKASFVRTTWIIVQTFLYIEKLLFQLASVRTTLNDRLASDFFPSSNKGRLLQPSGRRGFPSGRQSAMVRTRVQQIWKLSVEDQPSGRSSPWPGRAKPYMEITCSGRTTARTTVPHRPDAAFKQERFSAKISKFLSHSCPSQWPMTTVQMAPSFIKAVAHLNLQPINRGLWALRTTRIRY
jgi:hypothetical protein